MLKKDRLEYEFLPAALEISESPSSPLGSFIIWIILLIITVFFLWAYFGKIDEVAVAKGQVIPDGRVKTIQPIGEGSIKTINVKEGQKVKQGEVLMELDSSMNNIDVGGLEKSLAIAKLEKDVISGVLSNISDNQIFDNNKLQQLGLDSSVISTLKDLKQANELQYKSKLDSLKAIISQNDEEIKTQKLKLVEIETRVDELKKQEQDYKKLTDEKSDYKALWEAKQKEVFSAQQDYEEQKLSVKLSEERLNEANANLNSVKKELDSQLLEKIVEKEKNITAIENELLKAKKKSDEYTLSSPVNGIVHGLAENTIGGVVTPAQSLMTIVPEETPLIIEATVLNKDIGFINVDQEVEIKFDTFPFQKYGTVKGKVYSISPDAVQDEKQGLVYKIKVKPNTKSIRVDSREVDILPGMSGSVEVKTGKRRIINFFLDPIIKYTDESLKLR